MTSRPDRNALLEALAAEAREQEDRLAREADALEGEGYARLAAGTLDESALRRLEERALSDENAAAALAIFAPPAPARADALEGAVMASLQRKENAGAPAALAPPPPDDLSRARAKRFRLAAIVAPVLAAAAGLLLLVTVNDGKGPPEALPGYTLSLVGGEATERGQDQTADGGPVRLLPDAQVEIVLRPAQAVRVPVVASVAARFPATAAPRKLAVTPEIASTGAIRFIITAKDLGAHGTGELLFTVQMHGQPATAQSTLVQPIEVIPAP